VVQTQRPRPSALHMDEQLVQGDRPIVEYRRRREELMTLTPPPPPSAAPPPLSRRAGEGRGQGEG